MRAAIRVVSLLSLVTCVASAQTTEKHRADPDRLGLTCADILKMSSTEWVAYFADKTQPAAADKPSGVARATSAYAKCYDGKTDELAASLAKSGKGPSKAARADFASFETALKAFSVKALADAQPAADAQKRALAALYEKQFRYDFYRGYELKILPTGTVAKSVSSMAPADANKLAAPGPPKSQGQETPVATDEMGKAKNRFGELLGAQPEDKLHELHASFGAILGLHEVDEATTLAVYRYAIFLLEPTSEHPSYPPPF
jgi:hypothetical protein